MTELDPRTPVLVGVGQAAERIDSPDYRALSPVDLGVAAVRAAIADTGADEGAVLAAVDTVAATRQFENSTPISPAPLGTSTKYPLSVAHRLGLTPRRAVLEVTGGQSPQHLVTEFAEEIHAGRAEVVVLVGAEAISTVRHLADAPDKPDFSDDPDDVDGVFEDRGYGLDGLTSLEEVNHGLITPPLQYGLLENARRAARGRSRAEYARDMGELFAPFTEVAAANPYAAAPERHSAHDLATVTDRNRLVADPYPRFLMARDQVNQAAAIVLTSVGTARRLGVPEDRLVFLHGHTDLRERSLFERADLAQAPTAPAAVRRALAAAGVGIDEIDFLDLYSCFPIAVTNLTDALGLAADDPRGLTLTGGLPYFGGAGNNYSMHAIAEAAHRVREAPGSRALVSANGGLLSKTSVGVYSTTPRAWRHDDCAGLQREVDALPAPVHVAHPAGWATIESFTLDYGRHATTGLVVGRLVERGPGDADGGGRFLAQVAADDTELMTLLRTAEQPIGTRVYVTPLAVGNRVTVSEARAAELFPRRAPALREAYEFVRVRREGHLLEITIDRPEVRNALHPPAHDELAEIFDAYFDDPELWVAIITGAGETAFSAGNDLSYTASGSLMYTPLSGFAGLTSRRDMHKPVIAAVNGFAMGGGFEIALACHLVVADETATFSLSEVKVGVIAAAGGVVRLPRLIAPKLATELILTGRRISAQEARNLGLVNRVAPAGGALQQARELAAEILEGSPTSVRLSLRLMEQTARYADPVEAVTAPTDVLDQLLTSADAAEGITAFVSKRAPQWKNR